MVYFIHVINARFRKRRFLRLRSSDNPVESSDSIIYHGYTSCWKPSTVQDRAFETTGRRRETSEVEFVLIVWPTFTLVATITYNDMQTITFASYLPQVSGCDSAPLASMPIFNFMLISKTIPTPQKAWDAIAAILSTLCGIFSS